MYVWLSKRVRLADKTCTFGRQNMYVWPTKRVRLACKITSLGRELSTFDEQRHMFGHVSTRLDFENSLVSALCEQKKAIDEVSCEILS